MSLRVLIADDLEDGRQLLRAILEGAGFDVMEASQGREAFDLAQQHHPGLIVSDVLMPVMDGFSLCRACKRDAVLKATPFVFYTATYTDQRDREFALNLGADLFIVKPIDPSEFLTLIQELLDAYARGAMTARPTAYASEESYLKEYNEALIHKLEDKLLELEQANRDLESSEKRYREILDEIDDGYYEVDLNGSFTFFNTSLCEILGYAPDELRGMNYRALLDEANVASVYSLFNQVFTTGNVIKATDWELIRKDGSRRIVETSIALMRRDNARPYGFRGIARDITEQKRLQQQFIQSQKIETIGQLAGGIAHDFNNMLTPIMGYTELLLNKVAPGDPMRSSLDHIYRSAQRSRDLVRQLLAFARKQTLEMKALDLNAVITGFEQILRRTLHENVALSFNLAPTLPTIMADAGQIEQIIMNLSVNAQDAMPEGGTLCIETREVYLDETYVKMHKDGAVGLHCVLAISDTGTGMDPDTLQKAFDPFFTTKAPGKGTGLGLSTVYGIARQHGGCITAYSEPGHGTTFRIYFPVHGAPMSETGGEAPRQASLFGTETVLVVEDQPEVRDLIVNILSGYGYTVIEAADGREALHQAQSYPETIHILITDIILPDVNGRDLHRQLTPLREGMKVLYMSGYTADVISRTRLMEAGGYFIQKPFSLHDFLSKLRLALEGG